MRSVRSALALCLLGFAIPSWGGQASQPAQTASTAQPASDPQAVAVVQAAITALGGATAIGQAQSWTFEAQMQGPHAAGRVSYVMSTDADPGHFIAADGTTKPARLIHSHFVPALVALILLQESRDSNFVVQYGGIETRDSKPVTVIIFRYNPANFPAQIWSFDSNNLPLQIDFRLPAEIGAKRSFPVVVGLSNYQSVSEVLYPFTVITFLPGGLSQVVKVQSITLGATVQPNDSNGSAGDLR